MTNIMSEYGVTLLALNGREKDVLLRITREGVVLITASDGKEFNRFPFGVIKKWLPSHLRSRNPGPEDCLDLQIQTDKGARDLRMRCHDAAAVLEIIDQLRQTVMNIMREIRDPETDPSQPQEQDSSVTVSAPTEETSHEQHHADKQEWHKEEVHGEQNRPHGTSTSPAAAQTHSSVTITPVTRQSLSPGRTSSPGLNCSPPPATGSPSGVLTTHDLSSIPGAIPVTLVGTLPSPGRGSGPVPVVAGTTLDATLDPGVTQLILATAPTGALTGMFAANDTTGGAAAGEVAAQGGAAGMAARMQALSNSFLGSFERPAQYSSAPGFPSGTAGDDQLQVVGRAGSFGPGYMNAAYLGTGPPQGAGGGATQQQVQMQQMQQAMLAGMLGPGLSILDGAGSARRANPQVQGVHARGGTTSEGGLGGVSAGRSGEGLMSEMRTGTQEADMLAQQALDLAIAARLSSPPKKNTAAVAAAVARQKQAEGQMASMQEHLEELINQNRRPIRGQGSGTDGTNSTASRQRSQGGNGM